MSYSLSAIGTIMKVTTRLFHTLPASLIVALVLATCFLVSPVMAQGGGTTVGSLELVATFECIGVYANFTGDDNGDNEATLEYRESGGAWKQGMALTVDRRTQIFSADILSQ